jgi:hypothetical protein
MKNEVLDRMRLREVHDSINGHLRELPRACYWAAMWAICDKLKAMYAASLRKAAFGLYQSGLQVLESAADDSSPDIRADEARRLAEVWEGLLDNEPETRNPGLVLTEVTICALMREAAGLDEPYDIFSIGSHIDAILNNGVEGRGPGENIFNIDQEIVESHPNIQLLQTLQQTLAVAQSRVDAGSACSRVEMRSLLG